jgi:asparagine synthase (glutamine-hydrolysing)
MCGIAGSFQFSNSPQNPEIIRKMTACIAHRGPDADGYFVEGPVALGHRRLSIIDLSEKANQPIFDTTGRYVIIFNGEIYNYQEVKSKLPDYPFQTAGDTEVVLAAYMRWGAESLQHLKGMFAFAIWDKLRQELFITRDRLGVKPMYYYKDENHFLFGSEIRSILASGLVKRAINQEALQDYLYYQSFQSPHTIVRDVFELPSGSFALLSRDAFCVKSYWSINAYEPLTTGTDLKTIEKRVNELLLQSVKRRMVSDVPVAAFLSGGIDSSAVVGLMAQIADAPETFNIAFNEKEFDESGIRFPHRKKIQYASP